MTCNDPGCDCCPLENLPATVRAVPDRAAIQHAAPVAHARVWPTMGELAVAIVAGAVCAALAWL